MGMILRAGLAACACFMLAGCFVSDSALFSASEASYPFQNGVRYQKYSYGSDKVWKLDAGGTLSLNGQWYTTTDDGQKPGKSFILIPYGNYMIAEVADSRGYRYDLIRIDGNTVYDYGIACDDLDPDELKSQGLVSDIGYQNDLGAADCTVVSPDALKTIVQRVIAANTAPVSIYVLAN